MTEQIKGPAIWVMWIAVVSAMILAATCVMIQFQQSRDVVVRSYDHCDINLQLISAAIQLYHNETGRPLRAVEVDEGGKPYSWRVALLPFMGDDQTFTQYRRGEPWDSDHNRSLCPAPGVYTCPCSVERDECTVSYFAVASLDGSIVAVVESTSYNEVWTKPAQVSIEEFVAEPSRFLSSHHGDGANAVLLKSDRLVFLPSSITQNALSSALISESASSVGAAETSCGNLQ